VEDGGHLHLLWYPEKVVIPGVHPEDKIDATCKGDLAGMFTLDEQSKKSGIYDAGKADDRPGGHLQELPRRDVHGGELHARNLVDRRGLFIRTYTFDKNQARPKVLTATGAAVLQNPAKQ